jgi:hypothetical protein
MNLELEELNMNIYKYDNEKVPQVNFKIQSCNVCNQLPVFSTDENNINLFWLSCHHARKWPRPSREWNIEVWEFGNNLEELVQSWNLYQMKEITTPQLYVKVEK